MSAANGSNCFTVRGPTAPSPESDSESESSERQADSDSEFSFSSFLLSPRQSAAMLR